MIIRFMNRSMLCVFAILIGIFLLTACTDSSKQSYDPLGPRYHATLAEGITFSKDGYPDFLSSVEGISVKESFGRWTDGSLATIGFSQPLPKKFTLKIAAVMSEAIMGKPIKVVVGNTKYDAQFGKMWNFKEVAISVTTDGNAKSVVFELPDVKSPKELGQGEDGRRLGLALSSLKIE